MRRPRSCSPPQLAVMPEIMPTAIVPNAAIAPAAIAPAAVVPIRPTAVAPAAVAPAAVTPTKSTITPTDTPTTPAAVAPPRGGCLCVPVQPVARRSGHVGDTDPYLLQSNREALGGG